MISKHHKSSRKRSSSGKQANLLSPLSSLGIGNSNKPSAGSSSSSSANSRNTEKSKHKSVLRALLTFQNSLIIIVIQLLLVFIFAVAFLYTFGLYSTQEIQIANDSQEIAVLKDELIDTRIKFKNARKRGEVGAGVGVDGNEHHLIEATAKKDMQTLELFYGKGPIHVLLKTSKGNIVLEMAPISSMPHVILYFLNLVESNFWDGCHFFRNARHVIQANCHRRQLPAADTALQHKLSAIKNLHIVYQEYDETLEYLHKPYSIGLAGRPGGPDFYVNLEENLRSHGPGGQGPEPDPCFARVVEGRDVVDRIHALPDDGSQMQILQEWVQFQEVSVIQYEPVAGDGGHGDGARGDGSGDGKPRHSNNDKDGGKSNQGQV